MRSSHHYKLEKYKYVFSKLKTEIWNQHEKIGVVQYDNFFSQKQTLHELIIVVFSYSLRRLVGCILICFNVTARCC